MKKTFVRIAKVLTIVAMCASVGGCEDPQIYGSVGVSSFGGSGWHGSGTRVGTSITIGGRIR